MKRAGWLLLLLSGMVWTACSSDDDELVEVTPTDIRLRKKLLTELERRKYNNRMNR